MNKLKFIQQQQHTNSTTCYGKDNIIHSGKDNAMQCNAMQCNAMQCNAMQCNAMQCNAMQCNAMQLHDW